MLVRARVKTVEQMPPWAKCCDWCIAEDQRQSEMLIDLETIREVRLWCPDCGVVVEDLQSIVQDRRDGLWYPLCKLDLDEGPLEAA